MHGLSRPGFEPNDEGAVINLWNPTHVSLAIDLFTAFLLGVVHGVTPDEHTWPITFSYAVGGYSTKQGLRAGLTFSAAFTLQRALASELAYLGLAKLFTSGDLNYYVYVIVGLVMAWAGLAIAKGSTVPHFDLFSSRATSGGKSKPGGSFADPRPWMPAVHGFIAGWGFGAFATILYTVLAPAMPSAALGWAPGAAFGLGTMLTQVAAGAAFGYWAVRKGLPNSAIRHVGLVTASRTLIAGGGAFVLAGLFGILFPALANFSLSTGFKVHNLHSIGLPLALVVVIVLGVGVTTLLREAAAAQKHFAQKTAV